MLVIQSRFWVYVNPNTPDEPWVIRYEDPKMPEGLNEVKASEWVSQVPTSSSADEFLESRLGRWQVCIDSALMLFDQEKKKAYFTP
jgi:hypothetical protein